MTQEHAHICDVTKPVTDHILRLPVETLEHIASLCDAKIDSPSLRLSCHTLAGAALRSFANSYLAQLNRSIMHHDRLLGLEGLLKQTHLLKRVHLRAHQTQHSGYAGGRIDDENLDHCYCGRAEVGSESSDLVESSINRLGTNTDASLRLDFAWERESRISVRSAPQASTLLRTVLKMALSAACPITGLYLSDRFEADYSDVLPLGTEDPLLQRLDCFDYTLKAYGEEEDLRSHNVMQQRKIVKAVNSHARGLKHFAMSVLPWCGPTNETLVSLSKELLLGVRLDFLHNIALDCLHTSHKILMDFLDRCSDSLQNVCIRCVYLRNTGDVWNDVFRTLTRFKNLRSLFISQIYVGDQTRRRYVKFIVPESSFDERTSEMDKIKTVDPVRFLKMNVEKGIAYSYCREPEPLSVPYIPPL